MLVQMGNHAGIVPELYCSDFDTSLDFYTTDCGFSIHYTRAEARLAPGATGLGPYPFVGRQL